MSADHDDIVYPETVPFILVHLACFAAIWTGVHLRDLVLCLALYLVRMWAVTAGYHRYFSHRSYKMGRGFQFFVACLCQSTAQKGVLWWAAKHRHHHAHSDTEEDVHSPREQGFWFAHVGWIFARKRGEADYGYVPDFAKFPELVWLNAHSRQNLPALALAVACLAFGGWSALVVGFFWSTVLLFHGTFAINSLAHVMGSRRYPTGDDSRNNFWLALITLGEGWHNNHHYYQVSTRQGFRWWEVDATFYVLKALSWVGLVSDLKGPTPEVLRGEKSLPRPAIEREARQLVQGFSLTEISAIAARVRESWAEHSPHWDAFVTRAHDARAAVEARLHEIHLPSLPSIEELRHRAAERFKLTPSIDEIAGRARQMLIQAISTELLKHAPAGA
ncbi:MAG: fatty acid desaturase [Thermoanaerobaculia bacterium]